MEAEVVRLKLTDEDYSQLKKYCSGFFFLALCLFPFGHWVSGVLALIVASGMLFMITSLKHSQK